MRDPELGELGRVIVGRMRLSSLALDEVVGVGSSSPLGMLVTSAENLLGRDLLGESHVEGVRKNSKFRTRAQEAESRCGILTMHRSRSNPVPDDESQGARGHRPSSIVHCIAEVPLATTERFGEWT